jgi:hypothetical protein
MGDFAPLVYYRLHFGFEIVDHRRRGQFTTGYNVFLDEDQLSVSEADDVADHFIPVFLCEYPRDCTSYIHTLHGRFRA